jgi:hypothetical protein
MPPFYVPPFAPGDPAGLDVYEEILAAARETNPHADVGPRKIFRLECEYRSEPFVVEVGQLERATNEPVLAILDTDPYFVCTESRGLGGSPPVYVSQGVVKRVIPFDDAPG